VAIAVGGVGQRGGGLLSDEQVFIATRVSGHGPERKGKRSGASEKDGLQRRGHGSIPVPEGGRAARSGASRCECGPRCRSAASKMSSRAGRDGPLFPALQGAKAHFSALRAVAVENREDQFGRRIERQGV